MKKILLLGDSIRMGYDSYVKELMPDFNVVYDNDDNGRFIDYTIWQFNYLNNQYGPFDIVHFNTGYWDMNHEGPNGACQTPIPLYEKELKRLVDLIKATNALPIFSLTIPLKDELFLNSSLADKSNFRTNDDVKAYNKAAKKVMKKEGVQVIDLYSLMLKDKNYYKCPDCLHLTEDGYKVCANLIANTIRNL